MKKQTIVDDLPVGSYSFRCFPTTLERWRVRLFRLVNYIKIIEFPSSKKIATHPKSTPQAIPLANYERNPFIACWQRFRGVFQRCVATTLDIPHDVTRSYARIYTNVFCPGSSSAANIQAGIF